jgi:hypothetical protein
MIEGIFAGNSKAKIEGYRKIYLQIQGSQFLLHNVAHIPTFYTNIAFLDTFV